MFKVGVSESCTGGNIQSLITANSGVSQWFNGGISAYDINIKKELLGVPLKISKSCKCVSPEVASLMATGTNKLMNSVISVSTTGYVGTNEITKYPYCFIGIATPFGCDVRLFCTDNDDRVIVQKKMANTAIELMLNVYLIYKDKFMEMYDKSTLNHFEDVLTRILNK
jgi:nicotinamide-nucleotide amidase